MSHNNTSEIDTYQPTHSFMGNEQRCPMSIFIYFNNNKLTKNITYKYTHVNLSVSHSVDHTLRTATGYTQDTNIEHLHDEKHTHFPYTRTYSSTPHNSNRKHNINHIPYPNILQHSNAQKSTIVNNVRYTTNSPHTVNLHICHIHTSIVAMHLATGDNNKILCTLPPLIRSSEEILPRLSRCTLS